MTLTTDSVAILWILPSQTTWLSVFILCDIYFKEHKLNKSASRCTQQGKLREPSVTPFPTFCRILEALHAGWLNLMPHFASTPERRNENINVNKYFNPLFFMEKDKANEHACHLMVSDYRRPRHRATPEKLPAFKVGWAPEPGITWCETQRHKATT